MLYTGTYKDASGASGLPSYFPSLIERLQNNLFLVRALEKRVTAKCGQLVSLPPVDQDPSPPIDRLPLPHIEELVSLQSRLTTELDRLTDAISFFENI